ncbi:hypothetical protein CP532_6587 [Ophiocordyceps camponoti-leonardi (nom. inval.)]|nr:hypothetical protein CP532_6587 [Ophiocordyceps camponoti-leonardi (nom. inval.)]
MNRLLPLAILAVSPMVDARIARLQPRQSTDTSYANQNLAPASPSHQSMLPILKNKAEEVTPSNNNNDKDVGSYSLPPPQSFRSPRRPAASSQPLNAPSGAAMYGAEDPSDGAATPSYDMQQTEEEEEEEEEYEEDEEDEEDDDDDDDDDDEDDENDNNNYAQNTPSAPTSTSLPPMDYGSASTSPAKSMSVTSVPLTRKPRPSRMSTNTALSSSGPEPDAASSGPTTPTLLTVTVIPTAAGGNDRDPSAPTTPTVITVTAIPPKPKSKDGPSSSSTTTPTVLTVTVIPTQKQEDVSATPATPTVITVTAVPSQSDDSTDPMDSAMAEYGASSSSSSSSTCTTHLSSSSTSVSSALSTMPTTTDDAPNYTAAARPVGTGTAGTKKPMPYIKGMPREQLKSSDYGN